jgi:hypothetical protein
MKTWGYVKVLPRKKPVILFDYPLRRVFRWMIDRFRWLRWFSWQ